jgi:hypothetical protein
MRREPRPAWIAEERNVRVLLWMMGGAFILMWLLGIIFRIPGLFVWFLLGFGIAASLLGFRVPEEL